MKNYIINIDKLQLYYNNIDIKIIDKNHFRVEYLLQNNKLYNNDYNSTIKVYYKEIAFLIIYNKRKSCSTFSYISIFNDRLYTDNWNTILQTFLTTYKIVNWNYSKMEIAINTNDIITSKYLKLFKNGKINFNDNYSNNDAKDYGNTLDFITKNFSKRTFYIYNKKKHLRLKELRIEDKTNEISNNNYIKQYILDYYKKNGLNTSKNVYRMELLLNFTELRKIIYNTNYKNEISKEIISNRQYKKLSKYDRLNFTTINIYKDYQKSISIKSLTDEIFLTKLFNSFVMINYEILIKRKTDESLTFDSKRVEIRAERIIDISLDTIKQDSLTFDSLFTS